MATELKRFSVSIPPEMEQMLIEAKRSTYYDKSQSDMIRDLISRGLAVVAHGDITQTTERSA